VRAEQVVTVILAVRGGVLTEAWSNAEAEEVSVQLYDFDALEVGDVEWTEDDFKERIEYLNRVY
jgi:hypothetical protein